MCDKGFGTGRLLGGHMSRKHPGDSEAYNTKKIIYKFNKIERDRRRYFRNQNREDDRQKMIELPCH